MPKQNDAVAGATPYAALTPECLLDAIESTGLTCDGRINALNSYENRVYQVWLAQGGSIVAKVYRPRRWRRAAILEEHAFALALAQGELPVVAPMMIKGGTLFEHAGFMLALYPRQGGRTPEFEDEETLRWLGRFIARIHAIGALEDFEHRPMLSIREFGEEPVRYLLKHEFVPADLRTAYETTALDVLGRVKHRWAEAGRFTPLRLHGDCHAGNILWTDSNPGGPHFVDLDDARMGPAVQDIWMWLDGERAARQQQLGAIIAGYREFYDFNPAQLALIEPLRTLRIMHYAGWLARRWDDPAFPRSFPFFNTQRYWQDHILALREQAAALDEAPLELENR
ncbi:MAG: serine/threonine protein kinase [Betaproteobacteria bacterium]|nr:serine/threonine protein kinase [Betaproteobacteria bacterium]